MDEIDALRDMRTALARQEEPARLAARLDYRAERRERPRRGFRLPLLSLAGAAAVAAAGTVGVVVLQPDGATAPAPGGTAAGPAQPGDVLLVAATNAQKAPGGRYWHTRTVMGEVYAVGKTRATHYKVDSRQGNEFWTGPDGKGRSRHIELADVPFTAQDERKWKAAGSPSWVRIPDPEGAADSALLDMSPPSRGGRGWEPFDGRYHGMTRRQVAELPTQPQELQNVLLGLKGQWRAVSSSPQEEPIRALRGQERVRALGEVAGTLLSTAPAPPEVRAAVFRMLAAQPGVRAEGRARDPLGRTGTVISLPLRTTAPLGLFTAPKRLGTYRRQFVVDPESGTLLAIQDVVATPPRGSLPLPPGDNGRPRALKAENMPDRFHRPGELAAYQAFEITEWTDAAPPR